MSLAVYREKRRFENTPEPRGKPGGAKGTLSFVVQKHHASHLHYDFRLELDGVLKSWAVPKGPSLKPADKRLAVQVEDHPLDYGTFEGTIPPGNYGVGEVIVWDKGTYHCSESTVGSSGEHQLRRGLEAGRLSLTLDGHKVRGDFSLVRTRWKGSKDGKNWLLIKKNDRFASDQDVTANGQSVLSNRTLNGKRGSVEAKTQSTRRSRRTPQNPQPIPQSVKPMLATLADEPFDRVGWFYEIKWDGYRAIAEVDHGTVKLYSRQHNSFDRSYPTIINGLQRIPHAAVLDGEVVALDEAGRSQFQLLQNYRKSGNGRLVYCVFDLLFLNGHDLRNEPLRIRKQLLSSAVASIPNVVVSEFIEDRGVDYFRAAIAHGLEGIIAKDAQSPYREGHRGLEWMKVKTHNRQEAVIGGFTKPRGSRKDLGAVVLGVFDGPDLQYIGHTGGGSDSPFLADLRVKLEPLIQKDCPFHVRPKVNAPVRWVEPRLVCEVRFQEWTADGRMRQPVLLGLRADKRARSVRRERPVESAVKAPVSHRTRLQKKEPRDAERARKGTPTLTNLDKIYWPDAGYTKGDLVAYYKQIAPYILPYLHDRPLSLHRHPNGIGGESFFQKDVSRNPPPSWVKTVEIVSESTGNAGEYVACQNIETLLYVSNLGCIELNPWNARVGSQERPDYLVIDLDPIDLPFIRVVETDTAVRRVLEEAGAACLCKTSGKRGLHVFVPLGARYSHDEARQFAELIAKLVNSELPQTTSVVRNPRERKGRVYLDYLQNRRGQTVVAPYSVRPTPLATVSTPLSWREVGKRLDPTTFTIQNMERRLDRVGDLWERVLGDGVDLAGCLE